MKLFNTKAKKQKVIIFEGPDKVGKTEIGIELSKRIKIPYFKNEAEWENFEKKEDYFVNTLKYADPYMISFLKQTNHSAIFDRHYPSEWVYSQIFNRKTDPNLLRKTDEGMFSLGATIIICLRSDYIGRSDDLFPDKINSDVLKRIHDKYCEFSEWTKCKTVLLNVDDENLDREIKDILIAL